MSSLPPTGSSPDSVAATLLPSECPNCGRLHSEHDFIEEPGPIQAENARLREALAWIAYDSRPLNLDGHFDPAEWWKHVASTRREHAIAALTKGARS